MPRRTLSTITAGIAAVTASLLMSPAAGAATMTVSYTTDDLNPADANCSLREAIQVANTNTNAPEPDCNPTMQALGNDQINLGAGPFAQTIVPAGDPDDNLTGDFDIDVDPGNSLTVAGQPGTTVIDAADNDRVFHLLNQSAVAPAFATLSGVILEDGNTTSSGGGVQVRSNVLATISLSTLRSNVATGSFGGGVHVTLSGSVTITDSDLTDNTAAEGGGLGLNGTVMANAPSATVNGTSRILDNTAGEGGGIGAESTSGPISLTVADEVRFQDNTATSTVSGGGAINWTAATGADNVNIDGATFISNNATGAPRSSGGAIFFLNPSDAQLRISDSFFVSNTATGFGGVLNATAGSRWQIMRSTLSGNLATEVGDDTITETFGGGAIRSDGPGVIEESAFNDNRAMTDDPQDTLFGGVIYSTANLDIFESTLNSNLISGGVARSGAVLYAGDAVGTDEIRLENSTLTGNSAGGTPSVGGAIRLAFGTLAAVHTTFGGNTAFAARGIQTDAGTSVTLEGSILDELSNGCNLGGTVFANAFNVDRGTSCVGAADDTDLENTDPLLEPLMDNGGPGLPGGTGGPFFTMALMPGSPAIDLVPNSGLNCVDLSLAPLTTDQRGFARPSPTGGACDAGAFEVQVTPAQPPPASPTTPTATPTPTQPAAKKKKCKKGRKLKKGRCVKKKKRKR